MKPPLEDGVVALLVSEARALDGAAEEGPTPFAPKYKARAMLEEARRLAKDAAKDAPPEWAEHFRVLDAGLLYKLARNAVNTEERPLGSELLGKAALGLRSGGAEPTPLGASLLVSVLSFQGFIAEGRGFSEEAKASLHAAERVYLAYKQQYADKTPRDFDFVLGRLSGTQAELKERSDLEDPGKDDQIFLREKMNKSFESLHTHTLYFLAQVYTNLKERATGAKYCEDTLLRQLEFRDEFKPCDWALNATTLSQFFLSTTPEDFVQARHCLAAAAAVLEPEWAALSPELRALEPDSVEGPSPEQVAAEKLLQTRADLARCWAKYGILLLNQSQAWLLNADDEASEASKALNLSDVEVSLAEEAGSGGNFKVPDMETFEAFFPARFVTSFAVAKKVFQKVGTMLDDAATFYGVNNRASDYVEICQDRSRLFAAMSFYYPKNEDKAKLHKRRLDLIIQTLDGFNTQAYMSICRQMMFEIGEIGNEMATLKAEALGGRNMDGNRVPTQHEIAKINMLCDTGIRYFNQFLESFRDGDGALPAKFPDDAVRPVIIAKFYIARLFAKKLTHDMRERMLWTRASLECYKWIQKYCQETHPESLPLVQAEYDAAYEMFQLLPIKLARMEESLLG